MKIESENIKNYIINNTELGLNDEIRIENIEGIECLTINKLNYQLKEARFIPEELAYFKNLKTCGFSQFTIRDNIIKNLNKLQELNFLKFDHCRYIGQNEVENNLENIELNYSDIELLYMLKNKQSLKNAFIKDIENVDIEKISKYENLENLSLLNCEIKNAKSLLKLKNLKTIKIIGSKLDDIMVINKLSSKVEYSEKRYLPMG